MDDIDSGFYITEVMGFGANVVTGDYSQGAAGFWIEKGELAYPVSEMTVAGNLKEMFLELTPANDLEFRYATNSPTIRSEEHTSELQSLMRISYAVFCWKKKRN